jgi:tRNA pseudouridine55 synthase
MQDGILIINKPKTWTSFDVVAKVRNTLQIRKVGHTGTLDPLATGVLVLCLGRATKKVEEITGLEKEYIAEITLATTSNTDDAEGELVKNESAKPVERDTLESVLEKFKGEIQQVPPQFSAKQINGQRAYKLARKGREVKLEPRTVTIHELEILDYNWPILKLCILCGKGTYIRSIARDIGKELGCGAYMSELQRTKVGNFTLGEAITIEEVSEEKIKAISV